MSALRIRLLGAVLLIVGLLGVQPHSASAQSIYVCLDASRCTYTSIQAAIDAALSGDHIYVSPGSYPGKITISKNITISGGYTGGASTSSSIYTSDHYPPLLVVNAGFTASLDHFVISGDIGKGGSDAYIHNSGTLTLDQVNITNNFGETNGASAMYNDIGAVLTLTNSTISKNNCTSYTDLSGTWHCVGVLDNQGTATLTDDIFSGNSGGTVTSDGNITITRTTFTGESGENLWVSQGTALVQQSVFNGGGGTNGTIDAVYVDPGSTATINGDTFTGYLDSAIVNVGSLTMTSSSLWNNSGNGAISNGSPYRLYQGVAGEPSSGATIRNTTVTSTSGVDGIAIYDYASSPLTLTNDTLSGNHTGLKVQTSPNFSVPAITITNTILAGNAGTDCFGASYDGTVSYSAGHNVLGTQLYCGFTTANGTQVGVDPKVTYSTASGYGGLSMAVQVPQAGSPAIDGGDEATCQALVGPSGATDVDQLENPRKSAARGTCNIGAYDTGVPTNITGVSGSWAANDNNPTFTAHLQSGATNVSGRTIVFTDNGQAVCGPSTTVACPTTDANGMVSTSNLAFGQTEFSGLGSGTYANRVGASFAGDGTYQASSATGPLVVGDGKSDQTITFDQPADHSFGGSPFAISATSTSGLPVSLASATTSTCTVSGNTVTMIAVGYCTITASQAGNSSYNAAPDVSQTFTILGAPATITLDQSTLTVNYDGQPHFVTATTTPAGLSYSVEYLDATTYQPISSPTSAGSYLVKASITEPGYPASAKGTLTINKVKLNQTITFGSLSTKAVGDPDFEIDATASSGLSVYFTATGPCSLYLAYGLWPWMVKITGTGTGANGCTITASQSGNDNYNAATSVSRSFDIVNSASVSFTLSNLSQTYTGSSRSAGVTSTPSSVTPSVTYTGTSGTTYATSSTAPTDAGSYTVDVTSGDPNYSGSQTGTLTVTKADQTITVATAAPASTVYNGTFTVAATGGASGNPVTYGSSGGCTNSGTTYTMTSGTTACTVTFSQSGNNNYNEATQVTETVTATKAPLTITPTHAAISYGDPVPADGWGYTPSGFVNGDRADSTSITGSLSGCSTTYSPGQPAGSYAITCDTSGMSAANYTLSPAPGSLTVGTRAIEVMATNTRYTYGDAPPASYAATVTGGSLAGTDTLVGLGVTCSPAASPTATTAAGQYAITCSGGNTTEYSYTYQPGTLTIAPRYITVTAGSPASQTYGTPSPPSISCTGSGFLGGDSFTTAPTGGVYDATGVTPETIDQHSSAGSYTTACSGGAVSSNYTIGNRVAGTFTISPAPLAVTVTHAVVTYGDPAPTSWTVGYSGFVNGDPQSVVAGVPTCATAYTSTSSVREAPYAISCTLGSLSAANYTFVSGYTGTSGAPLLSGTATQLGSLGVNKESLSVVAPSATMTYGDATLPSLAPTLSGMNIRDSFTGLGGTCGLFTTSTPSIAVGLTSGTPAGTYTVHCSGVDASNYTISYTDGTLTVRKASLTITASSGSMTYGGTVPTITPQYSTFAGTDSPASLTTAPTCSTTASTGSSAGQYGSSCTGAVDSNYTISYLPGSVQINPVVLSVTAPNVSVQYSDPIPSLTPTVSGYVRGEGASALTTAPTCTSAVPTGPFTNAAGTGTTTGVTSASGAIYAITCSGGLATNYTFDYTSGTHYAPGTLTVAPENASVQVSASPSAQVLGTGPITLTATVRDSAASGYTGANAESGANATAGDITKTFVEFDIYNAVTCLSGTPAMSPVVSVSSSTRGVGTATYSLPSPSAEASYCVVPRIVAGPATASSGYGVNGVNPYYTATAGSITGIAFYTNSGQFATGGGWIADSSSSTGQGALGFNARYTKTGGAKGQMAYIWQGTYQGQAVTYTITSNAISTLTFSGTTSPITATLQGKCAETIVSVATGQVLSSPGNLTFTATAKDGDYGLGQNVPSDAFSLSVFNSSNQLVKQVTATPLGGGNLVVHNG